MNSSGVEIFSGTVLLPVAERSEEEDEETHPVTMAAQATANGKKNLLLIIQTPEVPDNRVPIKLVFRPGMASYRFPEDSGHGAVLTALYAQP